MLYVIAGSDFKKTRAQSSKLIDGLKTKRPDSEFFSFEAENISEALIEELSQSVGLFDSKYIVFFDHPFERKDSKDLVLGSLKQLAQSQHIFLILEGELLKGERTKFEKHAAKLVEIDTSAPQKIKDTRVFDLAKHAANGSVPQAFKLYHELIDGGEAPEAIAGVLFWKYKSEILKNNNEKQRQRLKDLLETQSQARLGECSLLTGLELQILRG